MEFAIKNFVPCSDDVVSMGTLVIVVLCKVTV